MDKQTLKQNIIRHTDLLIGMAVFFIALLLYISTLAPGLVFGDPSEYTFVPHIWGISHPPGYAFQTVLGGIWQRLIPIGSIAYRANLLSAFAGAGIAGLVHGSVRAMTPDPLTGWTKYLPGIVAGLSAMTATDIWQHSLHANAHIVTALLASLSLFLLLKWFQAERSIPNDRWLYAFCIVAGLSVTHHPLLVFSFPAYTIFIIAVRPSILLKWKTLLKMLGFGLLGLSVWLYLPIRASLAPTYPLLFGPDNTNTLNGFLDLTLARGLRVNLFHFGWADLPGRLIVFRSLLRLQAGWIMIALMVIGLAWLWWKNRRAAILFTVFLLFNLGFVLNTIQDVMAYLMVPFMALMILAGVGLSGLLSKLRLAKPEYTRFATIGIAVIAIGIPTLRAYQLPPQVSLRDYDEADRWVDEVYTTFEGQGEHAVLLAHWEHLTPLWYADWVEGRTLAEDDLSLVFVAADSARPWVDNVWANIDRGPIYVSGYQRELINEGFRLRPVDGRMYQVIPAPATDTPEMGITVGEAVGELTLIGFDMPETQVSADDIVPLSIALGAADTPADIIFPHVTLGEGEDAIVYRYTTDSHWLTPYWQPEEIIVERYDLRLPFDLPDGDYPLYLHLTNLTTGEPLTFEDGETRYHIGDITVNGGQQTQDTPLMANIAQRVGLVGATGRVGNQRRSAIWDEPLIARPGEDIFINLTWTVLAPPDDNWKVFMHLMGSGNQVITQYDTPPMGGSFPTFLWFPKWVAGQTVIDPYRLTIPEGTPPGNYTIEVGMYGFMTFQRVPFYDDAGNLSGDRFILGVVRVVAE